MDIIKEATVIEVEEDITMNTNSQNMIVTVIFVFIFTILFLKGCGGCHPHYWHSCGCCR